MAKGEGMKKRILLLMSDTGGGHRACAEAIQAALYASYGNRVEVELFDVFRAASGFPMNIMPEFYPWLIRHSQAIWGYGYELANSPKRAKLLSKLIYRVNKKRLEAMVESKEADVVVSVHSVITNPALWAWQALEKRPPFLAVITNLITTHPIGYNPELELTMLPNSITLEQALACEMPRERLEITGIPVHPDFAEEADKGQLREQLGWDEDKLTVLMVAGGDGMANLSEMALAINERKLDIQLVIVAGRNKALKSQLEAMKWNQPVHVYPFVGNMPDLMKAADVIITKAGPSSICEAAVVGLPMILISAIPGQETANIAYVVENCAGTWSPSPSQVADTLEVWSKDEALLETMSANAKKLANPKAAFAIAEHIMQWATKAAS
jgi:1,2-diacylglycerol 3-beta-galactosyltransferase